MWKARRWASPPISYMRVPPWECRLLWNNNVIWFFPIGDVNDKKLQMVWIYQCYILNEKKRYSETPPYDHLVNTTPSLLQPLSWKCSRYLIFITSLIRPHPVIMTTFSQPEGSHISRILLYFWIYMYPDNSGSNFREFCRWFDLQPNFLNVLREW